MLFVRHEQTEMGVEIFDKFHRLIEDIDEKQISSTIREIDNETVYYYRRKSIVIIRKSFSDR